MFSPTTTLRLLALVFILFAGGSAANAQEAAPAPQVNDLTKPLSWPDAESADVLEQSPAAPTRELRMPIASGSKFISSTPHGRFMLITPGAVSSNTRAMGSIYDLHRRMLYRKMPNMNVSGLVILSPEGSRLAAETTDGGAHKIVIASIIPPRPMATITLANTNKIQWMAFADDKTLLVMIASLGSKAELIAYDTVTTQQLWKLENVQDLRSQRWAMTPNGKYLALVYQSASLVQTSVALLDSHTGKQVGEMVIPDQKQTRVRLNGIAFSPDGSQMGMYFQPEQADVLDPYVLLFDAKTAQPVDRMNVGELPAHLKNRVDWENELAFIDDKVLLVKNELVLLRGFSQAVDAVPLSTEERRMSLRTTGRSDVLRLMKEGSNSYLLLVPIDLSELTQVAQEKEAALAAAAKQKAADLVAAAKQKEADELASAQAKEAKRVQDAREHARLMVEYTLPVRAVTTPDLSQTLPQGKPEFKAITRWDVSIDPADPSLKDMLSTPVASKGKSRYSDIAVSTNGKAFATLYREHVSDSMLRNKKPGDLPFKPAQMAFFNTLTGRSELLKDFKVDPEGKLMSLSFNGDRCAIYINGRLEIHDLPSGQYVVGFELVGEDGKSIHDPKNSSRDVLEAVHFITNDLVLTGTYRHVKAWSIAHGKVTLKWSYDVPGGDVIATPGGKYLLLHDKKDHFLVDAQTGEVKGVLPSSAEDENALSKACFSLDGKRLIAYRYATGHAFLLELDMTTGQWINKALMCNLNVHAMQCLSDKWLLMGDVLVDRATGAPLWRYKGHRRMFAQNVSPLVRYMTYEPNGIGWSVHAKHLPEETIVDHLVTSDKYKPIFGAGSKVSVQVNMSPERLAHMTREWNRKGISIAEDGLIKLTGDIKTQSLGIQQFEITKKYRQGAKTRTEVQNVNIECFVTTRTLSLLDEQGKVLWSHPRMASTRDRVVIQGDDNVATALSKGEHAMRVVDYSDHVDTLPFVIYRFDPSFLQGESKLTPTSSQPAPGVVEGD